MIVEFDKNPPPETLKKFGLSLSGLITFAVMIDYWLHTPAQADLRYSFTTGMIVLVFFFFGLFSPKQLKHFYLVWNYFGAAMGFVIGPIILTFFYYGVLTPIGLLSKLTGKQWLEVETKESHWAPLETKQPDQFEKLF